jgi:hypothetical protein
MWRETEVLLRLWRKTEAKEKDKKLKECKRTDIGRFICLAEHVNF